MEGVQFKWACYLCGEFLVKYREAYDHNKTFHYAWMLLFIVLVAWELPEDSQFPPIMPNLPEATKFTSRWVMKDSQRVKDSKVFWILMEMSIHMAINRKSWLLLIAFEKLQEYVEFKANFHDVLILA